MPACVPQFSESSAPRSGRCGCDGLSASMGWVSVQPAVFRIWVFHMAMFSTELEVFWLVCLLAGCTASPCCFPKQPSAWGWKSPWHFHTSFWHTLEMLCSPSINITFHTIPKLVGWCFGVWVSHAFPDWRIPCEIWWVEGHLRWGDWIPLSTPQMECVETAFPSLVCLWRHY